MIEKNKNINGEGELKLPFALFRVNLSQDAIFSNLLKASALLVSVIISAFMLTLFLSSWPFIKTFGLKPLISNVWDPIKETYGALPFIATTLFVSVLALLLSVPFSLSVAFLTKTKNTSETVKNIITTALNLIAAIPSVIYGFWGLFALAPIVRVIQLKLGYPPYGVGIFTAVIVLTIMIIPMSASIASEVLKLVSKDVEEASYALGANTFETNLKVLLPVAKSGILAGFLLSLGRALGETMAVTMVIGNFNNFPANLFAPGNTIASLIANQFNEASGVHQSALIFLGLILFLITLIFNFLGNLLIVRRQQK
ncbi:MAG: phosphate ABC transporter permease subunit PstC [bacterium]|nr:phosphate ABC transporter permease subunit PstC [bacterium]